MYELNVLILKWLLNLVVMSSAMWLTLIFYVFCYVCYRYFSKRIKYFLKTIDKHR